MFPEIGPPTASSGRTAARTVAGWRSLAKVIRPRESLGPSRRRAARLAAAAGPKPPLTLRFRGSYPPAPAVHRPDRVSWHFHRSTAIVLCRNRRPGHVCRLLVSPCSCRLCRPGDPQPEPRARSPGPSRGGHAARRRLHRRLGACSPSGSKRPALVTGLADTGSDPPPGPAASRAAGRHAGPRRDRAQHACSARSAPRWSGCTATCRPAAGRETASTSPSRSRSATTRRASPAAG